MLPGKECRGSLSEGNLECILLTRLCPRLPFPQPHTNGKVFMGEAQGRAKPSLKLRVGTSEWCIKKLAMVASSSQMFIVWFCSPIDTSYQDQPSLSTVLYIITSEFPVCCISWCVSIRVGIVHLTLAFLCPRVCCLFSVNSCFIHSLAIPGQGFWIKL